MAKSRTESIEAVLSHLASAPDLTASELRVFLAWFIDAKTFNAARSLLAKRTGLSPRNVRRALKGLVEKGYLVDTGVSGGNRSYRLPAKFPEPTASEQVTQEEPEIQDTTPGPLTDIERALVNEQAAALGLSDVAAGALRRNWRQEFRYLPPEEGLERLRGAAEAWAASETKRTLGGNQ